MNLLSALDDELVRIRSAMRRPAYRRRFLEGVAVDGGITTVRVLRSVERLGASQSVSIRDVAEWLGIEHSTASRAVDTAVRAGLLNRLACVDDRRKAVLTLTQSGVAILEKASQQRQDFLSLVTEGWETSEIERLLLLLGRLNDDFEQVRVDT